MTTPPDEQTLRVDAQTLRRQFILGRFEERVQRGELTTKVMVGSEHSAALPGEPPGTVSHMLLYFEGNGELVAMAHEYLRPDGSLGASGKRDPKWIRFGGMTYKQQGKGANG